jgi:uncharacterized membrane protein
VIPIAAGLMLAAMALAFGWWLAAVWIVLFALAITRGRRLNRRIT